MLRLGSYGEPVAVPYAVWQPLLRAGGGHTGYTHQWRDPRFQLFRAMLMASVESRAAAEEAKLLGWRTFLIAPYGSRPERGEFHCPASLEQNHRLTCQECGCCDGAGDNPRRASVIIWPHGPMDKINWFLEDHAESPPVYRGSPSAKDRKVLEQMRADGVYSASQLAAVVGGTSQSMAVRLWYLQKMGAVQRVKRGSYRVLPPAEETA